PLLFIVSLAILSKVLDSKTDMPVPVPTPYPISATLASESRFELGIYDPQGNFDNEQNLTIEHIFIDWSTYRKGDIVNILKKIEDRNRVPLITVEPWLDLKMKNRSALFPDIL